MQVCHPGGVAHTAPTSLAKLPSIAGLKVFVFIVGICFLGSAVFYGFYLLLQLGSGRLMLGVRLIRAANAPLREISYTAGLPLVTCAWLFVLGLYAFVVGELLLNQKKTNKSNGIQMKFHQDAQQIVRAEWSSVQKHVCLANLILLIVEKDHTKMMQRFSVWVAFSKALKPCSSG